MTSSRIATLDPAPPAPRDGGGGGRWAWLVTATGIVEAELIRGVLEGEGFPVVFDRRDPSPFAWMYLAGNVNAPVKVYVPATLLEAARLELLEAGFTMEPETTPPPQSPSPPSGARRTVRLILVSSALVVAIWIVVATYLGSATCALRLVC